MIDRNYLKKQMPHGSAKILAEKIGVTPKSISNYITGKSNSEKIELAVLQLVADLKKKKNQLLKKVYDEVDY
jgi:transcriptional regulator with XRE-family HTH domain